MRVRDRARRLNRWKTKQSIYRPLRLMWAGGRENLADIIYAISPMDTPFMRKGEAP